MKGKRGRPMKCSEWGCSNKPTVFFRHKVSKRTASFHYCDKHAVMLLSDIFTRYETFRKDDNATQNQDTTPPAKARTALH